MNISDEQIHVDLFCKIFKALLDDYPELDTPEMVSFITDTFKEAAELEIEWARYVIGWKIPGVDLNELEAYIKFMANNRSKQLGGKRPFPEYRENPMRWIVAYQEVDLGKTDFFEQKSRQYTKVDEDNGFDDL